MHPMQRWASTTLFAWRERVLEVSSEKPPDMAVSFQLVVLQRVTVEPTSKA
jgi:hypothetical protein